MYLSIRGLLIRHIAVALTNGGLTWMILQMPRLGTAAVVTSTVLVTVSTLITSLCLDGLIRILTPAEVELLRQIQAQDMTASLSDSPEDEIHPF
ncbi:MAG: hypothetical protein JJU32_18090 [Phormidium sp. BM_Day4_Bin.17]|nr:hypothetical protein [Phormidium sp. BM_Day4_Bin.17]UCJ11047.1 MAG: hypothetical protein JWS08_14705 [Phormidium sp. PBR-2020]